MNYGVLLWDNEYITHITGLIYDTSNSLSLKKKKFEIYAIFD